MICTSCIHTNRYFNFTEDINHFVLWITSGTKQYVNASVSSFLTVDIFFKQCQAHKYTVKVIIYAWRKFILVKLKTA